MSYAVAFLVTAFLIWLFAVGASWEGDCPRAPGGGGEGRPAQPTGLDKGIYVWPPAAQCFSEDGVSPHQAMPWASWAIMGLIATAGAMLLFGMIAAIRDLRSPAALRLK